MTAEFTSFIQLAAARQAIGGIMSTRSDSRMRVAFLSSFVILSTLTAAAQDQPPPARQAIVTVKGSVAKPGDYPIPDSSHPATVLTIVSRAGGLLKNSKLSAYIVRTGEDGGETKIPVPLRDIMRGKKPDFPVQPGDILYIPDISSQRRPDNLPRIDPPPLPPFTPRPA